ncbi:hypothetical protein GN958_ATG05572 [Phytophthora infestans]|uniref:Uncharacterized protein n=1 Tax=Phytophthora infestans TaxID=4787 RepID=A0A8S9V432_PHYIN|nr:hypothetical protein GN958_ATG05572 [Phytophthora infestans]
MYTEICVALRKTPVILRDMIILSSSTIDSAAQSDVLKSIITLILIGKDAALLQQQTWFL